MGAEYEELLTVALLKNGPIAVGFNAHGMDYYQHGVMGCDSSSLCNAGEIDQHGPCDPSYLDNYVLLVGYGEQDGVDYWVVKNSEVDRHGLGRRAASVPHRAGTTGAARRRVRGRALMMEGVPVLRGGCWR